MLYSIVHCPIYDVLILNLWFKPFSWCVLHQAILPTPYTEANLNCPVSYTHLYSKPQQSWEGRVWACHSPKFRSRVPTYYLCFRAYCFASLSFSFLISLSFGFLISIIYFVWLLEGLNDRIYKAHGAVPGRWRHPASVSVPPPFCPSLRCWGQSLPLLLSQFTPYLQIIWGLLQKSLSPQNIFLVESNPLSSSTPVIFWIPMVLTTFFPVIQWLLCCINPLSVNSTGGKLLTF